MARNRIARKRFRLNAARIKHTQRLLQAETETIKRALEAVISENDRNEAAREANERFVKRGDVIRDVYGTLEK
jgi:hypothetical protein